jgi:hypothetical protein
LANGAKVFFIVISFILLIVSTWKYSTIAQKKIIGIVDNIRLRNIQKRGFRRYPINLQVLSFRITVPDIKSGNKPIEIPSVYEYSGLNLMNGDLVEAYGYFRKSEFKVKKMEIINET